MHYIQGLALQAVLLQVDACMFNRSCMQDSFSMDVVTRMHVAEYDNERARQTRILDAFPADLKSPKVSSLRNVTSTKSFCFYICMHCYGQKLWYLFSADL